MATHFCLPDGPVTNLVMLSQKLFIARSIDQFIRLVDAAAPLAPGRPVNFEGLKAILSDGGGAGPPTNAESRRRRSGTAGCARL
jgi:hypothetical protein